MMLCRDSSRLSDYLRLMLIMGLFGCHLLQAQSLSLAIGPTRTRLDVCASVFWSEMPKWNATSIHKTANASMFAPRSTKACPGQDPSGEWLGCRHGTLTASACPKYAATCSSCHRTMEVPGKGYAGLKAGTGDFGRSNDGELIVCKSHQKIDVYIYISGHMH